MTGVEQRLPPMGVEQRLGLTCQWLIPLVAEVGLVACYPLWDDEWQFSPAVLAMSLWY